MIRYPNINPGAGTYHAALCVSRKLLMLMAYILLKKYVLILSAIQVTINMVTIGYH